MNPPCFQIGVDGGGTTTRAVVVNEKFQVLGRGEAGSSNHYSVGLESALGNIRRATSAALLEAGIDADAVGSWGFGLAGARGRAEQDLWRARLQSLAGAARLAIDEDAAAAQAGAFAGREGAICIAGTGANCFGINARGERARGDGLGPLLGDRGSGYAIGENALRAICRAEDATGPKTMLREQVLAHLRARDIDELVQLVYRPDFTKDRIAALFPIVLRCAAHEDEVASALLRDAGRDLAATTIAVLKPLELMRVAVCGGVLSRETPVRAAFESALLAQVPDARIQEPLHDAAIGAALLGAALRAAQS